MPWISNSPFVTVIGVIGDDKPGPNGKRISGLTFSREGLSGNQLVFLAQQTTFGLKDFGQHILRIFKATLFHVHQRKLPNVP